MGYQDRINSVARAKEAGLTGEDFTLSGILEIFDETLVQ